MSFFKRDPAKTDERFAYLNLRPELNDPEIIESDEDDEDDDGGDLDANANSAKNQVVIVRLVVSC